MVKLKHVNWLQYCHVIFSRYINIYNLRSRESECRLKKQSQSCENESECGCEGYEGYGGMSIRRVMWSWCEREWCDEYAMICVRARVTDMHMTENKNDLDPFLDRLCFYLLYYLLLWMTIQLFSLALLWLWFYYHYLLYLPLPVIWFEFFALFSGSINSKRKKSREDRRDRE